MIVLLGLKIFIIVHNYSHTGLTMLVTISYLDTNVKPPSLNRHSQYSDFYKCENGPIEDSTVFLYQSLRL